MPSGQIEAVLRRWRPLARRGLRARQPPGQERQRVMADGAPTMPPSPSPPGTTAALVLADGSVFWGRGIGAAGMRVGEVCFNTSMTGYQEIMTDPSYAGQIVTFTFPHIGNVGTNAEDIETLTPAARGLVVRVDITDPSNYRAQRHFDTWL